jgi:uncharacterized DUF497 family protein
MRVVWDPARAASNLSNHGIRFGDAELALFDPQSIEEEDLGAIGERRYLALGRDALGRILVVVYTYRDDHIRLISARRATSKETRQYEEGV